MHDSSSIVSSSLITGVLEITREASKAVLEIYETSLDINYKDDNSPVTNADILAHDIIFKGLNSLTPGMSIVSEEGDLSKIGEIMTSSKSYWLVDPIDGTKDFINHTGQFTICIALIANFRPELGFIAAPAIDGNIYYGGANYGSFIINNDNNSVKLKPDKSQEQYILTSGSINDVTQDFINNKLAGRPFKKLGSQLKFLSVAKGEGTYPRLGTDMKFWDVTAGQAIIEGVGGQVVRPNGELISYNTTSPIIGDFVASL